MTFHWIRRGLESVLAWLLAALVLLTTFELLVWVFLQRSFAALEEIQGLMMIWFGALAAAYCLEQGLHLSLEFVVRSLPDRWRRGVHRFAAGLVAFFGGLLAYFAVRLVRAVDNTLPATGWSAATQYVPMIVAGPLIFLFGLLQLIEMEELPWDGKAPGPFAGSPSGPDKSENELDSSSSRSGGART